MRLRTELELAGLALVAIQVLTSFATIGLLVRMSPAVEQDLDENIETVGAVQEMFSALVLREGDRADAQARFANGLQRARVNVTEPEEEPFLDVLDRLEDPALQGDPRALWQVVNALDGLSEVNHNSITRIDVTAKRLGYGGAWAAAVLGVMSFAVGVIVSRRLVLRVEGPLAEVDATLAAARRGDGHRRCAIMQAPDEVARIGQEVNDLLDQREASSAAPPGRASLLDRAALLHLLEASAQPLVLVDERGVLHAANAAGHERLAASDGPALRTALRAVVGGDATGAEGITLLAPLADGTAGLCALPEARRAAEGVTG